MAPFSLDNLPIVGKKVKIKQSGLHSTMASTHPGLIVTVIEVCEQPDMYHWIRCEHRDCKGIWIYEIEPVDELEYEVV